jgi:hypothetical protein
MNNSVLALLGSVLLASTMLVGVSSAQPQEPPAPPNQADQQPVVEEELTGEWTISAELSGTREVPPASTPALGTLSGTYNEDTGELEFSVRFEDLTGPPTAAHFHGPAGENEIAPPVIPVMGDLTGPIEGTVVLNDDLAGDLTAGQLYFNIHTAAFPAGEIRGQVEAEEETEEEVDDREGQQEQGVPAEPPPAEPPPAGQPPAP